MSHDDDDNESSICFLCEKVEENTSRIIECLQCGRCVHFRCKKVFGNAVGRMRGKSFFCSGECFDMHLKTSQSKVDYSDIVEELRSLAQAVREVKQESTNVRIVFEETQQQIITMVETTKRIEESQDFLASQFDSIQADFNSFKNEVSGLKQKTEKFEKEVKEWQLKHQHLSTTVAQLELEVDKLNRSMLSKNAVLLGIPCKENEDLKSLVRCTGNAVGCRLAADAIIQSKRLYTKSSGKATPPILVTFASENVKENFFECKRKHGVLMASEISEIFAGFSKRIIIRDEMTPYGRELLRKALEYQTSLDFKYVWPGRDGKVLVKRHDGGKVEQITSKEQLISLLKTSSKRGPNPADTTISK